MSASEQGDTGCGPRPERRRAPRIPLPPGTEGLVDGEVAVLVRNLAPLGASVDHVVPLLPGRPCLLRLAPLEGAGVRLPARVIWSRAYPIEGGGGEEGWAFRSGVEFWGAAPAALRDLCAYLDRLAAGREEPLTAIVAPCERP